MRLPSLTIQFLHQILLVCLLHRPSFAAKKVSTGNLQSWIKIKEKQWKRSNPSLWFSIVVICGVLWSSLTRARIIFIFRWLRSSDTVPLWVSGILLRKVWKRSNRNKFAMCYPHGLEIELIDKVISHYIHYYI